MRRRWLFFTQRLRREKWLVLGQLLVTFAILVLGVTSAVSGLDFGLLWFPIFLGVVLGWGLAASPVSGGLVAIIAVLIGPTVIMIQIGNLMTLLAAVIASLFQFIREAVFMGVTPAVTPLNNDWEELTSAISTLVARLYDWLSALIRGDSMFDPVATAFLWLLVLWGAAVWAGWTVRRRNQPMLALLPALMLLAIMLTVSGGSALYLAPALALTLISKANTSHRLREQSWKAAEIDFSPRPGRNIAWTASGLALLLMLVALIAPSPSIYRLVDYARNLSQQQRYQELARSLGLEAAPGSPEADAFNYERLGGLPARHLIGSGPELSQQSVMAITLEGPAALTKRLRYWRGVTYDHYTGHGWETRGTTTITYQAGEMAGRMVENRRPVRQEVRPLADMGGLLYTAGTLTTVDRTFQVAWRARFRDTETYTDFFAAAAADGKSSIYRADSHVPFFNEAELRAAGIDSPDWITEQYLVLPDGVSDRVRALARDLTATEPTPYDRALAIEQYLRHFPYTLDLPAPPADREIADYFLFDLQRGYCDYYATTMVVLARAAGLPARLVTGFTGGAYDEATNRYTVTADLAHSWPEVYFPEYGWIPFEPTAGRAAIDRPAEIISQVELEPETEVEPITAARSRARWKLALRLAVGLILTAAALALGWWLLGILRLRFLSPNRAIVRIFEQMNRSGQRFDLRIEPGATPHEFADRLNTRLVALYVGRRGGTMFSSAPEAIDWLTDLYTYCLFSPYEPEAEQNRQAIRTWSRLRLQLLWASLLLRSEKIFGRIRIRQ